MGTGMYPNIISVEGSAKLAPFLPRRDRRPIEGESPRRAVEVPAAGMIGRARAVRRTLKRFAFTLLTDRLGIKPD